MRPEGAGSPPSFASGVHVRERGLPRGACAPEAGACLRYTSVVRARCAGVGLRLAGIRVQGCIMRGGCMPSGACGVCCGYVSGVRCVCGV